MATNPLKFVDEISTRAKNQAGDQVRRNFDALDELRTENARLRQELIEEREEKRKLREELNKRPVSLPATVNQTPPVPLSLDNKDDTEIRFSLLELDKT